MPISNNTHSTHTFWYHNEPENRGGTKAESSAGPCCVHPASGFFGAGTQQAHARASQALKEPDRYSSHTCGADRRRLDVDLHADTIQGKEAPTKPKPVAVL